MELRRSGQLTGWEMPTSDPKTGRSSCRWGCGWILGGVAKGWAAQQAMRRLKQYGPALVDAGGDIAVSGLKAGGQPWLVGIDDPWHVAENLGTLRLGRCGVATSGRDHRRWQQDGRWQHHIIDPRTGEPAVTDVLTATVVAPNVMEAEMAAKVVIDPGQPGWDGLAGAAFRLCRPGRDGSWRCDYQQRLQKPGER